MYDIDLLKMNHGLVKALQVTVAARRMIGKGNTGYIAVQEIESEIRAAAAECQRVLVLVEADGNRPLLTGDKG